jgi:hypothetical protein
LTKYPCYSNGRYSGLRSDRGLVGSRGTIKPRPSHLDLDVPLSVHPAPDFLGSCLAFAAHVDVIMAALMDHNKVAGSPVCMVSIRMMQMNTDCAHEFQSA